jgi:hypothetical protein
VNIREISFHSGFAAIGVEEIGRGFVLTLALCEASGLGYACRVKLSNDVAERLGRSPVR